MSVQLIAWAYEQRLGNPSAKLVLVTLANRANHDTGSCFPSLKRVSEETDMSYATVKRAVVFLEERGLLTRERRRRKDGSLSTYEFTIAPGLTPTPLSPEPEVTMSPSPGVTVSPQEPEVNLEPEEPLRNGPTARPRNPTWDALTTIFGEPTTESAQRLRGKVCRSLSNARASPDEIIARARRWPRYFEDATLTETALEKHWDMLGRPPLRVERR